MWCNDLGQIPCTDPPTCCKMCEQNAVSRPPDPLASLRPAGRCVPPPVCDPCLPRLPRRVPARVTLYCPAALLGIRVLPLTPLTLDHSAGRQTQGGACTAWSYNFQHKLCYLKSQPPLASPCKECQLNVGRAVNSTDTSGRLWPK